MSIDMTPYGGRAVAMGNNVVWDFGYRGPGFGSQSEQDQEDAWIKTLPRYQHSGATYVDNDFICWAKLWHHPDVIAALGQKYECVRQFTGSCVGAGGGNLLFSRICYEVIVGREPEKIFFPFWPLTYGRSRFHGGMNGRGEGSFESAWMEAIQKDGTLPAGTEGTPLPTMGDGYEYSSSLEMQWSAGNQIPDALLQKSRKFKMEKAAIIKNADEGEDALHKGHIVAWCGMWGGLMKCPTVGNPPVLMNRKSGQWAHKESCQGVWRHPELGRIFKIYNQWGLRTHGTCPTGVPGGGYWISEKDFELQAKSSGGEVIAYELFQGLPGPTPPPPPPEVLDWSKIYP